MQLIHDHLRLRNLRLHIIRPVKFIGAKATIYLIILLHPVHIIPQFPAADDLRIRVNLLLSVNPEIIIVVLIIESCYLNRTQ